MRIKSEVFYFVLLWSCVYDFSLFYVFDPKLDHPEANVINSINNRVNLNPSGCKHLWVEKQQRFIFFGLHTISFIFKVFIQNWIILEPLSSTEFILESTFILGIRNKINKEQHYFILLWLLSSCKYYFSISQSIWFKTGSVWSQCH